MEKHQRIRLLIALAITASLQTGCTVPFESIGFLKKSSLPASDGLSSVESTSESLDPLTEKSIRKYGSVIQKYSERWGFDPRLILAIMKQESRFRHNAKSRKGAYGLMQIMPVTQGELVEKLGVGNATTPYNNIKAGIFHLRSLYKVFEGVPEKDRLRLALGAYNAGLSRILDAQDIARFLGDDPNSWKAVRDALPLLSRRYHTLHKSIWAEGMPRGGYFRGWRQTTSYVENIMKFYREYQRVLPAAELASL
ncbi:MAG TPA: transglycosylase SLT domain-containing protein [Bacteroidota bacterium]|nr:transglycosylase SLT domain-containing protein [Bacteroidota bacterium]